MNELNELIANASDAQLAHLALFFADWMQTPDADDAVSRAALRIVQEIRFRAVDAAMERIAQEDELARLVAA
jgi:hypothetical protein